MPTLARSFPPIAAPDARVLILGSMPGVASLEAQEYYAHPRNAFWPIVGELFGFDPALPYEVRCERLKKAGVAVWDVLKLCRREGSLDSAIDRESEESNQLARFLAHHPGVRRVAFNGRKAETAFRHHVAPELPADVAERVTLVRLPSTSPAHAGRSVAEKLAEWRRALLAYTARYSLATQAGEVQPNLRRPDGTKRPAFPSSVSASYPRRGRSR